MLKALALVIAAAALSGCVTAAVMATGAVVGGAAKATGAVVGGTLDVVTTSDEEKMKKDYKRMKREERERERGDN